MRDRGQVAVRFGVKIDPPALVVEYASRQEGLKRPATKDDGLRHKVLRLHHLGSSKAPSCNKVLYTSKQVPHNSSATLLVLAINDNGLPFCLLL